MSQLLIRRDPLYLVEREGMVEASRELPDFLRKNPLVASSWYVQQFYSWEDSRLLLKDGAEPFVDEGLLSPGSHPESHVPALWSGYRSCLTQDGYTGELFRLKGVAFDKGLGLLIATSNTYVEGGQFLRNAHFERVYSNCFNRTLREEGLEPVMEYVGMYRVPCLVNFPNKKVQTKRRTLATSIMRVKGDTRLDELFAVLEGLLFRSTLNNSGEYIAQQRKKLDPNTNSNVKDLYQRLGKTVGQLKRLMDKSKQTWSDNPERSNAHIGNVVVYENDAGNLAVGLVDFDASCDLRDKTLSELRKQQKVEYEALIQSAHDEKISYRTIGQLLSGMVHLWLMVDADTKYCYNLICWFRQAFVDGFKEGYASRPRTITNVIPGWRFEELFSKILEPEQPETRLENLVKQPEKKLSYLQITPSCRV